MLMISIARSVPISRCLCEVGLVMAKITLHIPRHRPRITSAGWLVAALALFWAAIAFLMVLG